MEIIESVKKTLKVEADSIYDVYNRVGKEYEVAVDLMLNCKGKVVVTGMGKSGQVGKKIAATLSSTGTPAVFLHPAEGVHGDLGIIRSEDVVVAISNSGETEEIIALLPVIRRFGVKIISIVGRLNSTLAERSDCVIDASVQKEACPLNLAPTASTTVALAIGDALAVALLERKGFKEEDFAVFHPSGSLGKKLLTRVEDLYHKGDLVPIVEIGTKVADAVYIISSKGFGCAAIVDKNKIVVGIITDGDLRRGMQKYTDVFERKVEELGSNSPKLITKNELAAKALKIMEENSITSLLIVDENKKIDGIIHLHDLLRAKIV
ncbi:KpsF/GutQ family sugar-phosphate isomerase [Deferribacterales bacterium Es71-Z0220]|uniref:KpsF/GutQ family sugar-phosphate isomerase n=1 Tax=Deferrivibrio essentukiensis TaxID=2880922 RepID=UPI001F60E34C|nr:KpsF/GutQ family sugar-phosphate isomerase [Deferrivibrio essentukiensis]MCB4204501.1 KpsF/GutQ family sugar-phosphate isomerase [Deferrivibrio essentukiensis]